LVDLSDIPPTWVMRFQLASYIQNVVPTVKG